MQFYGDWRIHHGTRDGKIIKGKHLHNGSQTEGSETIPLQNRKDRVLLRANLWTGNQGIFSCGGIQE